MFLQESNMNPKREKAFAEKYDVHLFPALLIMDQNANKIAQLPLTFDSDVFIDSLNDFFELDMVSEGH